MQSQEQRAVNALKKSSANLVKKVQGPKDIENALIIPNQKPEC
jgi:hypothetical protein